MRVLAGVGLMIITVLVAVSCGGNDDDGQAAITEFPDDTFGIIDGRDDGEVRFPVLELWDIPICNADRLITNAPHGTRVRVLSQKKNCPYAPYEVIIAEGDKEGIRGWARGRDITLDDATESPPAD